MRTAMDIVLVPLAVIGIIATISFIANFITARRAKKALPGPISYYRPIRLKK